MKFNKGDIADVRGWVVKPEALTPAPHTLPPPGTVVISDGYRFFVTKNSVVREDGESYAADYLSRHDYEVIA